MGRSADRCTFPAIGIATGASCSPSIMSRITDFRSEFEFGEPIHDADCARTAGQFSQTLDVSGKVIPITDPTTGFQFPGNVIPQTASTPMAWRL